jgi:predicted P-loop ATPase
MNILNRIKGYFHIALPVSSPSGKIVEPATPRVASSRVQSFFNEFCSAFVNNQKVSNTPLSAQDLEALANCFLQAAAQLKTQQSQEQQPEAVSPSPKIAGNAVAENTKNAVTTLIDFLHLRYAFRYNVLTRETEMRNLSEPTAQYVTVTEREMNSLVLEAQTANVNCWDKDMKRILRSAQVPSYHPFQQYFDNLPKWDGKDRVTPLAQRVSKDNEVWTSFAFHRWMLATAAQWMNFQQGKARANCVAPLLVSEVQGLGKSTFCRMLLPSELQRYYTESFDLSAPSSCEAKLGDYGIINLDEFDKITAKQQPALKNLMQLSTLNVKRAYATTSTPLYRLASFIGTSNRHDLLVDKTGSRRFICVEVTEQIDCETPIEYEQLYAQLKEELENGERSYFNKEEEAKIQENNRAFYRTSVEEEALLRHYRFAEKDEEGAVFMSATEIYKELRSEEGCVLRGVTAHAFSRLLPTIGHRTHTKWGNGYYVVKVA